MGWFQAAVSGGVSKGSGAMSFFFHGHRLDGERGKLTLTSEGGREMCCWVDWVF